MNAQKLRPLYAAAALWMIVSCQRQPAPLLPTAPTGPVGDDAVLVTLDCYEPTYQRDANGRVIKLRLIGRHVPISALKEIAKLTEVFRLDFYGSDITDDGIACLKDMPKLRALGVGATAITEASVPHFEKMPSLQYLWLPKKVFDSPALQKMKDDRSEFHVYPQ